MDVKQLILMIIAIIGVCFVLGLILMAVLFYSVKQGFEEGLEEEINSNKAQHEKANEGA